MFNLYELDRAGAVSPTGDMNQWVNELIAPDDRARMKVIIDSRIMDANEQRYFAHYRIITRAKTGNPGLKSLEVSGNCIRHGDEVRLRAIAWEVPELQPVISPDFDEVHTGSLLQAAFDLASDQVLFAMDRTVYQTFMTSKTWDDMNLRRPRHGYIPNIIHPDDFDRFRAIVDGQPGEKSETVKILLDDGRYAPFALSSRNAMHGADPRYIMCSLKPEN